MQSRMMSFRAAAAEGVALEMRRDPTVYCAGEEVSAHGQAYGVSGEGIFEEFGEKRVRNTPIIETAIVGHAVGAAAVGLRPVVELMFMDFLGICMDELGNQAAKMHYMFAGQYKAPMVLRVSSGAVRPAGAHHSQSLEAWAAHVPGLKIVAPSTPADAKGLMISSIRDDNPVVFVEHRGLLGIKGEVPEGNYQIPIGKAEVRRRGRDVTLIAWSAMVPTCLEAASELASLGVDAEVIDLRTLIPLDKETVLSSVAKTGRLVIAHEATRTSGFGAEIAAMVADEGFTSLKAPVRRVTAPDIPVPCSPALLKHYVPNAEKIRAAAAAICTPS
ncbi:MAG TPA: alpha-ketoacid dehydrogenase subunit beta [Thermoleophilia bacterium]|nr:alpha-ketoacid dehydrogenase subunit beta [Thermoleophilia bacterium]